MHICRDRKKVGENLSQQIKLGVLDSQTLGETHFQLQATHNPTTNETQEKMDQTRIELVLVLKHVT